MLIEVVIAMTVCAALLVACALVWVVMIVRDFKRRAEARMEAFRLQQMQPERCAYCGDSDNPNDMCTSCWQSLVEGPEYDLTESASR